MNLESSLDANLIIHYLLDDVPGQRQKVIDLLNDIEQNFYINDLVFSEVIYVLKGYKLPRDKILNSIKAFVSRKNVFLESNLSLIALEYYASHPSLSFVDCYSAFWAEKHHKEPLLTFDKKLSAQHPSAKYLV